MEGTCAFFNNDLLLASHLMVAGGGILSSERHISVWFNMSHQYLSVFPEKE